MISFPLIGCFRSFELWPYISQQWLAAVVSRLLIQPVVPVFASIVKAVFIGIVIG